MITVNEGTFIGGGGLLTFQPGAELNLLGNRNSKLDYGSVWHFNSATKVFSTTKKLILKSGSKIYIDEDKKVEFDIEVVVKACAELIIEKNALLKIKKLTIQPGGTLTVKEGAHITFTGSSNSLLGINNLTGTSANPIIFRANTQLGCEYEDTIVIGTTIIDVCTGFSVNSSEVIIDPSITTNPVACDFPCPLDNSWLTVDSKKDGSCPTETDCEITHYLSIPDSYRCSNIFPYYQLETILNSDSTLSSVTSYSGQTVLPGINRCIKEGDTFTVKIYLMRSINDPTPCVIEQTVSCECICPDNVDDWFDLSSLKNGGTCMPNQCLVTHNLNIPADYPCYTHFTYTSKLDGIADTSIAITPITSGALSALDLCIEEGGIYEVTIELYKGASDPNPCSITKQAYCEIEPEAEPCLPDCFSDTFTKMDPIIFFLNGCPNCIVKVTYSSRYACFTGWQDIQITGIEKFVLPGYSSTSCDGCDDANVYQQSIFEIISKNDMGFNPKKHSTGCSEIWRVSKASCWATWDKVVYNPVLQKYTTYELHKPCNSDCCLRRMEVCRFSDESISVTDLGNINSSDACSGLTYTTVYTPSDTINCLYTCDMLENIDQIYLSKTSIESSEMYDYFPPSKPQDLIVEINISQDVSSYNLVIANSNASNIRIDIYDINGKLIAKQTSDLANGTKSFSFDISNYRSGVYIVGVVADGIKMSSYKFNVTK